MRAGLHRHSVTLQQRVLTQDSFGGTVETWQDFACVNASVSPLTAREFFNAAQVQADVTHKVSLRYLPNVVPAMRVKFGTRTLHVASVINVDERSVELQLLCKETV